jgi:1,4-alpha-glucan branching enzyme
MISNRLLLCLCLSLSLFPLFAQVSTNPTFPTTSGNVSISFDATKGNRGLEGCRCDVYMHTGLITSKSTSPTDWKYVQGDWGKVVPRLKMTQTGIDRFVYTFNIKEFYGVPDDEKVLKLAFVFRNADGSKAGRAADGSDIYVDIYENPEDLILLEELPGKDLSVLQPGQSLSIKGQTNRKAKLRILDAEEPIFETSADTNRFAFTYTPDKAPGLYPIMVIATEESTQAADTLHFSYFLLPQTQTAELPAGLLNGINRLPGGEVVLYLEAPLKSHVIVLGDMNNWQAHPDYVMQPTPDGNGFWLNLGTLEPGRWYRYQYLIDGELYLADPFSELVLDPSHDPFIGDVFRDLPPYPEAAKGHVTIFRVEGFPYNWQVTDFEVPAVEDLFVYELLVRDFLASHSYADLIDTLDYLQRLGVNAIELLPVNEFEGNISWGYNPSFHLALDKYYGDPVRFKEFIDAAHARGMAVIVDIVLNHAFGQSPLVRMYWDEAKDQPAAESPYFNPIPKHPFNVGYDFNHESPYTQRFVDRVVRYWLQEYHIDGYRFDLSKGLTQKDNLNDVGAWGAYDASRIRLLKRIYDQIRPDFPDAYLILEHFAANSEELELTDYGFMVWGNIHFSYKEALLGYHSNNQSNLDWTYYATRNWTFPHVVSYMESHDEQRLMYENVNFGRTVGSYAISNFATSIERIKMAQTLFWTIPGPKMIWQFGEVAYDFPINYCEDGSVQDFCRTGPKPIRWDYYDNPTRRSLYTWISDLAYLKRQFPQSFRGSDMEYRLAGPIKWLQHGNAELQYLAVGNFDLVAGTQTLTFPTNGKWYDYLSGDSITVSNNQYNFNLAPGAHHLWLNQRILRPGANEVFTDLEDISLSGKNIRAYPNPVGRSQELQLELSEGLVGNSLLRWHSSLGQVVAQENLETFANQTQLQISVPEIPAGIYFLSIFNQQSGRTATLKVRVE